MKIKVLLENTRKNADYEARHGLSLLIEYNQQKFLFDTGPNKSFLKNAHTLNEDLHDLSAIILSHGHSDHAGGLPFLDLSANSLYTAENACEPHYIKVLSQYIYVGIPKKIISEINNQAIVIREKTAIAPNVYLIPLHKATVSTHNLYKETLHKEKVPDDFTHELMLVIEEDDGLIVFTGCSHHGIVSMAEKALALFPNKKIKYLIGGFHLIGIPYLNNLGVTKEEVYKIGNALNSLPIEKIITCHCTGKKAFALLETILEKKLQAISTGEILETDAF